MTAPLLAIVGLSTGEMTRISVFTGEANRFARLSLSGGVTREIALSSAPPCALGTFEIAGLPAGTAVRYAIDVAPSADLLVTPEPGPESFRVLPGDRPLRIALVSCNGTFTVEEGRRHALWERLRQQVDLGLVDLIIHAGDQIYADPIWKEHETGSARVGDPGERREALTRRYREWTLKTWLGTPAAGVLARCPSVMMWDDHDIYDGWGSNEDDIQPTSRLYFDAARQAFSEFQARHNPPGIDAGNSFATGFVHGEIGVLLIDGRTHRNYAQGVVVGKPQWASIDRWLQDALGRKLRHLFVVVGVPPMHVELAAALSILEATPWTEEPTDDLRDAWISKNNRREAERLLYRLFQFRRESPDTMVTLLSGDVHVGTLAQIESTVPRHQSPTGHPGRIFQVVSSGIGHAPPEGTLAWMLRQVGRMDVELASDIHGKLLRLSGIERNMLCERNFAVLDPTDGSGERWEADGNLRVLFHAEGSPKPLAQVLRRR